jgi:hypothetical protein
VSVSPTLLGAERAYVIGNNSPTVSGLTSGKAT